MPLGSTDAADDDADTLLARAVAGDTDALARLLERIGPAVRARLRGRIAAHWQAVLSEADVMQVTYLEAFIGIREFRTGGVAEFAAWLTRIARNNLHSAVRGLSRAKRPDPRRQIHAAPAHDSRATLLGSLVGDETTPSVIARSREALAQLDAAIERLPADYARVIRMYDLEGHPIDQVAATLKRSAGAVYMIRSRALERLRALLGPDLLSTGLRVSSGSE